MEQTGKFDASGHIRDLDAPEPHGAKPPHDSPMGVGIGDRTQVAAVEAEILQGAGIERVQFPQCCGVSPGLPQPMPSELERCPQRGQHCAGDSIEPKAMPADIGRSVGEVACRRPKRNLAHLWLAKRDCEPYVVLLPRRLK
jgi:hypothetical protein